MAIIPPATGGSGSDPPDAGDVDLTTDDSDSDAPTTPTGPENPFNDAGSYDDSDSGSSDPPTTPTGVQNPFDWQVDDGDVTAPPEQSVTEGGNVAGGGTVVEDDGSLDINPDGDTTVDPTDADHNSDPSSDGATETSEPDTTITDSFGGDSDDASDINEEEAEEIVDQVGREGAGMNNTPTEPEPSDSDGLDSMLLLAGFAALGVMVSQR